MGSIRRFSDRRSKSSFKQPLAAPRRSEETALRRPRENRRTPQRLVSEETFKSFAVMERRRVDRSGQPYVLLLVSANTDAGNMAPATWGAVIDGLIAAKRESDVVGWFRHGAVIGVIPTEIQSFNASAARQIEARVWRELARRLTPDALRRFSIRLHVQQDSNGGEGEVSPPADPILKRLCTSDRRPFAYDVVKRVLDIIGSSALLLALAPVFLLIALSIKATSRGPVFFRQVRVGEMATSFTMLKFRTMKVGADHRLHQEFVTKLITSKAAERSANTGLYKIADDPRVTPVGWLLRKTSLDELPQLWNVLWGDMSLVGPRPPLHYEFRQYRSWHRRRVLDAKPGLTGLWQVTGRSRTTFDEMVRLDLRYARTRSLWTDIKILLATPGAVISGKGAC
jgi:lipopolysaccharide/colanic/teichoic acid biosynthesis glycosyltransferase